MTTLTLNSAKKLVSYQKTSPILDLITPRWVSKFLPWEDVPSGIFRVNKVISPSVVKLTTELEEMIDRDNNEYESKPAKYMLKPIIANLKMPHILLDLMNDDEHNQLDEQIRLDIEEIMEQREFNLLNDENTGLLNVVKDQYTIRIAGPPTPSDLDRLRAEVWQKPCFFIAHPDAIAVFEIQCNNLGLSLETVKLMGYPFVMWKGLPIIPSDKIPIENEVTKILLVRVGKKEQGVIGLTKSSLISEYGPGISVKFKGIDDAGIASYLITTYYNIAVLSDDALGCLECKI